MAGTVVFDLDGTLVDTSADLIGAANMCFRDRGLGDLLDAEGDMLVAFQGARAMLRNGYARIPGDILLPPDAIEVDHPRLLAHYAANIAVASRPYAGVEAALEQLALDGWRLCVCTNKPEKLAKDLLDQLGLSKHFSALVGADTLPVSKPDPRPYREAVQRAGGRVEASFLIGDTITDFNTARAAEVPIALIGFGPQGKAVLTLKPDAVLNTYDELPALAQDWLGRK